MDGLELRAQLEKHHCEGYGWALCCCHRDPLEAENVLQAVYVKVLDGKARFDGKSTFKTWLFAVIRMTAADERRRKIFQWRRWAPVEKGDLQVTMKERPDEEIYRSELQILVRRALADLPRRQREVSQLVFYHELTLEEAAEVMGVSIGSVRTHYDRGKKRLRQWMEEAKVFDESE